MGVQYRFNATKRVRQPCRPRLGPILPRHGNLSSHEWEYGILHHRWAPSCSALHHRSTPEGLPGGRATREDGSQGGEKMKGRIQIKSLEEGVKDFRATWKAVAAGKKVTPRKGTYFTSLEAARKVLTPKRLQLLRVIRKGRPDSVYQLAPPAGPAFKNAPAEISNLGLYLS